jgi:carboxylesterase
VSANIIHAGVSSPNRELLWYNKSGHEMMMDLEKEQVFEDIMEFVKSFRKQRDSAEAKS